MLFIPSMIWLGLILLLQYFILNYVMSIFRSIRFLYTTFVMVMIYLWINLELKLLIFPTDTDETGWFRVSTTEFVLKKRGIYTH
jgi:hypothetical protein